MKKKILFTVFGDLHIGLRNNAEYWHDQAKVWAEWFVEENKKLGVKNIVFPGDFFDKRHEISVKSLKVGMEINDIFTGLDATVHTIAGNHDCYFKDNNEINSLCVLGHPFRLYEKTEIFEIDGRKIAMVPWGASLPDDSVDVIVGHFETIGFQMTGKLCDVGEKPTDIMSKCKLCLTGHFHRRQHRKIMGGDFHYVGNVFQMDFSDSGDKKGYYIVYDDLSTDFVEYTGGVEFIVQRTSDVLQCKSNKDTYLKIIINEKLDEAEKETKAQAIRGHYEPKFSATVNEYVDEYQIDLQTVSDETTPEGLLSEFVEAMSSLEPDFRKDVSSYILSRHAESKGVTSGGGKHVEFKKLVAKNFMSIGTDPLVVSFEHGLTLIHGTNMDKEGERSNATGKSTILDAIYYAIFGKSLRDIKGKQHFVNYHTGGNTVVVLDFDVNQNGKITSYQIVRGIKPDILELVVDGKEQSLDSKKNTTEFIADIISGTTDVFMNCLIMSLGSDNKPFLQKSAADRRSFIEGIFGLGCFSDMSEAVKKDIKTQKNKVDSLYITTTTHVNSLAEYDASLDELRKQNLATMDEITKLRNEKLNSVLLIEAENAAAEAKHMSIIEEMKKRISMSLENNKDVSSKLATFEEETRAIVDEAKARNDKIDREISAIVESKARHIENQGAVVAAIKEKYDKQRSAIVDAVNQFEEKVAQATKKNAEILGELVNKGKSLASAKNEVSKQSVSDLKKALDAAQALSKKTESNLELSTQMNGVDRETIERLSKENQELESSDTCPTCGTVLSKEQRSDHIKKHIEANLDKIAELKRKISKRESEITGFQNEIDNQSLEIQHLTSVISTISEIDQKISDLRTEYLETKASLEVSLPKYDGLPLSDIELLKAEEKREISEATDVSKFDLDISSKERSKANIEKIIVDRTILRTQISDKMVNIDSLNVKLLEFSSSFTPKDVSTVEKMWDERISALVLKDESLLVELIAKTTQKISVLNEEFAIESRQLKLMETAKFVLSDEGAKSFFFKKILSSLNARILLNTKALGSNIQCVFDEYLEDKIFNEDGNITTYQSMSGAERKTVDMSLMLAFYSIKMAFGGVRYNIMLLDEVLDSSFDKGGVELLMNLIKDITTNNRLSTLVISHRIELAEQFDRVIRVVKSNGICRMVE